MSSILESKFKKPLLICLPNDSVAVSVTWVIIPLATPNSSTLAMSMSSNLSSVLTLFKNSFK